MKSMKVSIITCTYNSAATVADTIRSVNRQTYDNIEHIIVDGLSKDDTIAIVKANAGDRQREKIREYTMLSTKEYWLLPEI